MALRGINGTSITVTLVGVVLVYSGIKGKRITTTVHDLVAGNNPMTNAAVDLPILGTPSTPSASVPSGSPTAQELPIKGLPPSTAGGSRANNLALGKVLAAPFGWSIGNQWDALVKLWDRESGWSNTADNPSSHAYGIPQALPPTKMPLVAQAPYAGGHADAAAQIIWGLTYIRQRYGNPVNAWAHEESAGWY